MSGTQTEQLFADLLTQGASRLQLPLDREAVGRICIYFQLLQKWAGKVNLIARDSRVEDIAELHFLDSLTLLPLLPETGGHLLDVGSGAGFPGLVLAAVRPEMRVTLVEPRQKRAAFLRQVVRSLALPAVQVCECRIEEFRMAEQPEISHLTSRAVADIADFMQLTCPLLRSGLQLICMKSRKWRLELTTAMPLLDELPLAGPEIHELRLPFSEAARALICFRVR